MKEITEAEAIELARGADCPVISQETNDETDSDVCLKKFPSCYVLGASCDATDTFKLYGFDDLDTAKAEYETFVGVMRRTGTPFGALS
jgi:hypothetical protein